MTPRERVLAAVRHKGFDRIPHQLDTTDGANQVLSNYFHDENYAWKVLDNHLLRCKNKAHRYDVDGGYHDLWGVEWYTGNDGTMGMTRGVVLPEPDLSGYAFPVPDPMRIQTQIDDMIEKHPDRFRIFEASHTLFEPAWGLRTMEEMLCDMLTEPEFTEKLFDQILEYQLGVIDAAAARPIDCIMFGDDWGQQKGLIMGAPLWRRWIQPRMRRLFDRVKQHGLLVCLHSCGDLREILGDLIDMGLDIYNTFQPEIYDVEKFSREYGGKLTIYGGISTQGVMAFGTPQEVRDETRRMMDLLGPQGYIVSPTHQITPDTPVANVLAFMDAVQNQ